jgi:hypothetical protein
MMQPYLVEIYVYANEMSEVKELQDTFHALVNAKRDKGIAVTAAALTTALTRFKDNFFVDNFLKANAHETNN